MRIEQFEYLVDIYKTKSITKTAENFFISRQVVSHAIHSLEDELDVQLLENENRKIHFTLIGEIAAQKAQKIMDAYTEFLEAVSTTSSADTEEMAENEMTILAIPRLAIALVPKVIAKYQKQCPHVNVNVITKSSQEILDILADNENAIGLISYHDHIHSNMEAFQLAQYPNLMIHPLMESQFYICMNKNSKYSKKKEFEPQDLEHLPLISFDSAYSMLGGVDSPSWTPNITSTINDMNTLCALIRQDLGVGLLTLNEYNNLVNNKNFILKTIRTRKGSGNIYFAYVFNESGQKHEHVKKLASLFDTILEE